MRLTAARRIIVKVGSRLLVDADTGALNQEWLASLVADLAAQRKEGKQVLLVSSGAVALGRRALDLKSGDLRLEESQAAAAVGQVRLAQAYVEAFRVHGITAAQILLTLDDSEERQRYLNARETLRTLLALGVIPVINENDTVATAEIRFGDNDRLAARVVGMVEADALILLSDVDGLYDTNPQRDPSAKHIPDGAGDYTRDRGDGERPCLRHQSRWNGIENRCRKDCHCRWRYRSDRQRSHSASAARDRFGWKTHPLRGARFPGDCSKALDRRGPFGVRQDRIDTGAEQALLSGKSLLPAGVTAVAGNFERGDVVIITNSGGRELGRGLIAYNFEEARLLIGHRTVEIEAILGYRGRDELIHRDDLALVSTTK